MIMMINDKFSKAFLLSLTYIIIVINGKKTSFKSYYKFSRDNSPLFHRRIFQHDSLPASAASPSCDSSDYSSDTNLSHESEVVTWATESALMANKVGISVVNFLHVFVDSAQLTKFT